jgi:hypothetical protein
VVAYAGDTGNVLAEAEPTVTVAQFARLGGLDPDAPSDVSCRVTGTFAIVDVPASEQEFWTVVGPGFCELANYSEGRITVAQAQDSGLPTQVGVPH